jgi:hypothetical protein
MTSILDRLLPALDRPQCSFGNAQDDGAPFQNWLIGHFVPSTGGLRHSDDIEIKWGVHPKGAGDDQWTVNRVATSISILVSGVDRISLPHRAFTLSNPGDYLIWGPGMPHRWQAVEDSVVITVRWPSMPDDTIEAPAELVELIREQYRTA